MRQDLSRLVDGTTYRSGNPFDLWRRMRENEPVLWHDAGIFGEFWSVTSFTAVKECLRDPDTFTSSSGTLLRPLSQGHDPGSGKTLALSDAPRHTALRAAVADWFSPRSLRTLTAAVQSAAHATVTDAVAKSQVDFVVDIAAKVPLEVVWTLLDVPTADRAELTGWSMDAFCAGTASERSIAHLEILDYFSVLAEKRRSRPGNDLVSVLATAEFEDTRLPLDEVVLNCDNLLVGGTENVRLAMSGGMQALLERPEQWALLRDDFDRVIPTAVDEILRWTSSATHLVRTAQRDTEIGGRRISAGDRVVLWLTAANRDPVEFAAPDTFDVTRSPNHHLALGAGPHYCIGVQLAKLEIRAVLRELTSQVRRASPDGPAERLESIVVNGLRSLPVRLDAATKACQRRT
ncbi:cytochrome P450 [Saccharopolyspora sp. ASAGF58]|uniref:cytochrome P450 n=1 Tax=Saccharopolyspora sp. ASAGF58 TaxID=2719023 RepID=UPI00143FF2CB|nr:cytochrome P450 [Saccharopolyspora sp. ASAGF58]QIZ37314.1 cytochrome P450 [Saccharopolyspora sp. ASAGF58]